MNTGNDSKTALVRAPSSALARTESQPLATRGLRDLRSAEDEKSRPGLPAESRDVPAPKPKIDDIDPKTNRPKYACYQEYVDAKDLWLLHEALRQFHAGAQQIKFAPKPKIDDVDPKTGKFKYACYQEYEDAKDLWLLREAIRQFQAGEQQTKFTPKPKFDDIDSKTNRPKYASCQEYANVKDLWLLQELIGQFQSGKIRADTPELSAH